MNWEQKFAALNALKECSLKMRGPGDWYVSQSAELKEGGMLRSAFGNGKTPEDAVLNHWNELVNPATSLKPIVIAAYTGERREVFWNGFMWIDCMKRAVSETKTTNNGESK
jgi:hypothetical protein